MPAKPTYPLLPEQILQVCNYKRGLSIREITQKVRDTYYSGAVNKPVVDTVYQVCVKLVDSGDMFRDDSGWRTRKDRKFSIRRFIETTPQSLLWYELMECLYILAEEPLDNAPEIKITVRDKILPALDQMRMIIELVDKLVESPDVVAFAASHEKKTIKKHIKYVMENNPVDAVDIEFFWQNRDTFGDYIISLSPLGTSASKVEESYDARESAKATMSDEAYEKLFGQKKEIP